MTNDHAKQEAPIEQASNFSNIAEIAKAGLKTFALTHFVVDFLLGAALAVACFFIAYEGVWWHGMLAAAFGLVTAVVLGTILAIKLGVVAAAMRAGEKMGLGQQVLNSLFNRFSPEFLASKSITIDELRGQLTQSAADVAPDARARDSLSGFGQWIVRKIWSVITWAVVRTILRHASNVAAPNGMIDVNSLRDHLATRIDMWLVDYLRSYVRKITIQMSLLAVAVACMIASAIRYVFA